MNCLLLNQSPDLNPNEFAHLRPCHSVDFDGVGIRWQRDWMRTGHSRTAIQNIRDLVHGDKDVLLAVADHSGNRVWPWIRGPPFIAVMKVEKAQLWHFKNATRNFLAECRHEAEIWPPIFRKGVKP